jgi:hypothetical protein
MVPADEGGQSAIPAAAMIEHRRAVEVGEATYLDPETGYQVMTAPALLARGYCCGNGCRHCPYPAEEQLHAGRPSTT